jgi:molybdopterin synthase catalytic subunit
MTKYGFDLSTWERAKDEVKSLLIERAKLRGMIPYSDLVRQITSINIEAHDQRLFHLLGEVSTEEHSEGRGMLTVIVVHKHGDMQPGPGFFDLAKQLGKDTSDILSCWIKELKNVHGYWSNQT